MKSSNKKSFLSPINAFLLCILFILVALLIRVLPYSDYHPMPGGWEAWFAYDFSHLGNEYHHLSEFESDVYYDYTAGAKLGPQIDQGYTVMNSTIVLILGMDIDGYLLWLRYFLIIPLLVWPLIVIAIYRLMCSFEFTKPSRPKELFLFSFALFANYAVISLSSFTILAHNLSVPWILLTIAIYFGLRSASQRVYTISFILVAAAFAMYYNTFSGFCIIILSLVLIVLLLWLLFFKSTDVINQQSRNLISYYLTCIISTIILIGAFYIYVNTVGFSSNLLRIQSFFQHLDIGGLLRFSLQASDDHLLILIAKLGTLLLSTFPLFLLSFVVWKQKIWQQRTYFNIMVILILILLFALVIFSAIVFSQEGLIDALNRINNYLIVPICIAIVLLLSKFHVTKYFYYVLIFGMLISVSIIFWQPKSSTPTKLTVSEYSAIESFSLIAPSNPGVYTDLRLGATLAWFDIFRVTGAITSASERKEGLDALSAVYYETDGYFALQSMKESLAQDSSTGSIESPCYALFSRSMSDPRIGIVGEPYVFKIAPPDFLEKLDGLSDINLILNNGEVVIYYLQIQ
jgi:hypothetical protein